MRWSKLMLLLYNDVSTIFFFDKLMFQQIKLVYTITLYINDVRS